MYEQVFIDILKFSSHLTSSSSLVYVPWIYSNAYLEGVETNKIFRFELLHFLIEDTSIELNID